MQSCIICLEEAANLKQLNHCGVYYVHKQCYKKWKSKNNTCIVCREQLAQEYEYEPHTIIEVAQQEHQELHYTIISTLKFRLLYSIIILIMIILILGIMTLSMPLLF